MGLELKTAYLVRIVADYKYINRKLEGEKAELLAALEGVVTAWKKGDDIVSAINAAEAVIRLARLGKNGG